MMPTGEKKGLNVEISASNHGNELGLGVQELGIFDEFESELTGRKGDIAQEQKQKEESVRKTSIKRVPPRLNRGHAKALADLQKLRASKMGSAELVQQNSTKSKQFAKVNSRRYSADKRAKGQQYAEKHKRLAKLLAATYLGTKQLGEQVGHERRSNFLMNREEDPAICAVNQIGGGKQKIVYDKDGKMEEGRDGNSCDTKVEKAGDSKKKEAICVKIKGVSGIIDDCNPYISNITANSGLSIFKKPSSRPPCLSRPISSPTLSPPGRTSSSVTPTEHDKVTTHFSSLPREINLFNNQQFQRFIVLNNTPLRNGTDPAKQELESLYNDCRLPSTVAATSHPLPLYTYEGLTWKLALRGILASPNIDLATVEAITHRLQQSNTDRCNLDKNMDGDAIDSKNLLDGVRPTNLGLVPNFSYPIAAAPFYDSYAAPGMIDGEDSDYFDQLSDMATPNGIMPELEDIEEMVNSNSFHRPSCYFPQGFNAAQAESPYLGHPSTIVDLESEMKDNGRGRCYNHFDVPLRGEQPDIEDSDTSDGDNEDSKKTANGLTLPNGSYFPIQQKRLDMTHDDLRSPNHHQKPVPSDTTLTAHTTLDQALHTELITLRTRNEELSTKVNNLTSVLEDRTFTIDYNLNTIDALREEMVDLKIAIDFSNKILCGCWAREWALLSNINETGHRGGEERDKAGLVGGGRLLRALFKRPGQDKVESADLREGKLPEGVEWQVFGRGPDPSGSQAAIGRLPASSTKVSTSLRNNASRTQGPIYSKTSISVPKSQIDALAETAEQNLKILKGDVGEMVELIKRCKSKSTGIREVVAPPPGSWRDI